MDNKILNLYPIDFPFETLVSRVNSTPQKLLLDPDFQRKYKWDKDGNERCSKFIESCLMRIPIPACYFAENTESYHSVIDGVQRITTICRFFNDEFALEGLTIFKDLEGKKFSELGDLKNELESTTIRCIVLRKENPKELISEIFARLNQGAVQLTDQEIRHAVYSGGLDLLLIELGQTEFIKNFQNSGTKDDRSSEEIILRFFAFNQNDLTNYDSRLKKLLDNYMISNQNLDNASIDRLRTLFNQTLTKCINTFDNPFVDSNLDKPRQSVSYYDLLMWSFSEQTDDFVSNNRTEINTKFSELCSDPEFRKTLAGGLQQKSSILKRRELWTAKLAEING